MQIGQSEYKLGNLATSGIITKDDRKILTLAEHHQVYSLDTRTGKIIKVVSSVGRFYSTKGIIFSKNERRALTWGNKDSSAYLIDCKTARKIGKSMRHNGNINGAIFSKDESRILTWSEDGNARIWESRTGRQIGKNMTPGASINGAVFSRDENCVLTWSEDSAACIWDYRTGKQIGQQMKHRDRVNGAIYLRDNKTIITWGQDSTTNVWHIPGDIDFPEKKNVLQLEAITGTEYDDTHEVKVIRLKEYLTIRKKYIKIAQDHLKECKCPFDNIYTIYYQK
jgi:WD40 repeat protein